jgi:hypothetical protein
VLAAFKAYDNTSVLSTFEVDTSQHYEDGVYIYLNVSWAGNDTDAETKSDTLLNNVDAIIANMSTTLPQPFDSVVLSTSLNPVTMKCFVLPTILSITTTYVEDAHNTDVEVKTVGLYDHIGIKINKEDDNGFRRLRNQQITTAAEYYDLSNPGGYDNILNIVGVDPTEDTFIVTLFDNDYKKRYTSIQTPTIYMQQTQGTNGDLLNETVDGSITLDLNFNEFTTENQTDFIDTMNSETGGDTTIVNTSEGSAIVEYRVIFDVSKTQQEIDDVVTKLNDDVEIQNIINKSATMNGVVARKTVNKTTKRERRLTKKAKVFDVVYDEPNSKILFKTIGSYNHILYKATEQNTFLSTINKIVDLPPGFTNKIDVKLVDVNDGDITTAATHYFDLVSPVITLIGDAEITLSVGEAYVEQGATVSDNSGETLTAVITGTVDVNTEGMYTVTYIATDSSGNQTVATRQVVVTSKLANWSYDLSNGNLGPIPLSLSVIATTDFTISTWLYLHSNSVNNGRFFDTRDPTNLSPPSSSKNTFDFYLNGSNAPGFSWDGFTHGWYWHPDVIPLGQWVHFAMMVENQSRTLFLNGVPSYPSVLDTSNINANAIFFGNANNPSATPNVSVCNFFIVNSAIYSRSGFQPTLDEGTTIKDRNDVIFFLGPEFKNLVTDTSIPVVYGSVATAII